MTLEEIKAFLAANKDTADVKAYLDELSAVSADKVKGYLEQPEGKQLIQPMIQPLVDAQVTKGIETFKTNNLPTLIDDEVNKRNPSKSPAEIELEKLRTQFEDSENARTRETLKNKALSIAGEKKLPTGLLDYFLGKDEETTVANLAALEAEFTAGIQAGVDAKFKAGGRDFNAGGGGAAGAGEYGKKLAEGMAKSNEGLEDARKSYFE